MKKKLYAIVVMLFFFAACFAQQKNINTITGNKISVEQLDAFINNQMDSLHIPGLSLTIINNGTIAYSKNYGVKNIDTKEKVAGNTIFELCSVSKPVFAYFVLTQVQKSILNLDTPLYRYYTDPKIDTANGYYKLITARMVLNHCSGFPNWRKDEDDSNPLFFINKPGTKYGYSGEGYQYLARVLGKILRKTDPELNDYFQKEVVQPLKISSMNFTWNDTLQPLKAFSHKKGKPTDNSSQGPADWFGSAGSLHTNANEYAKFLITIMNSKNKTAQQLLALNTTLPKEPDSLYRSFGFPYKMAGGKMRYYHSGNNSDAQSYCHFYLKEKMGLIVLANCDNLFQSKFMHKLFAYLDEEMTY
jgi:CubicO group peptidase (beta-lactamase class C family)